ncbi:MAG: hypothetical protein ABTD50_02385 [Polyangiaceae bacterium]|jgi:hypothetical protein
MGDKNLPVGVASGSGSGQVFYRYVNPEGRLVVTDTPPGGLEAGSGHGDIVVLEPPAAKSALSGLEMRSLWVGVALGIVAGAFLSWLLRLIPRVGKLVVGAGILVVGALAYLGWMRRSAGLSQDLDATPQALIDDAKQAVEKMNARMREQDDELKKLEHESKK